MCCVRCYPSKGAHFLPETLGNPEVACVSSLIRSTTNQVPLSSHVSIFVRHMGTRQLAWSLAMNAGVVRGVIAEQLCGIE